MQYVSTRGKAPPLGFEEAMLAGLARDGGLYVPETWPRLGADDIAALAGLPYEEAALRVMRPFVGDAFAGGRVPRLHRPRLRAASATPRGRRWCRSAPNDWLLELFHGPTLAFKDVAMQLIGQLFAASLARSGGRLTIVGATSGDTGAAAIEAFRGQRSRRGLHPVPRGPRLRGAAPADDDAHEANVHALAHRGRLRRRARRGSRTSSTTPPSATAVGLAGVNSINWARVLAQIVYYFTAAVALGAPRPRGQLHRADRQLRRHLRRLRRQAHGAADRPPGHRHQPERHPAPHARHRRAPPRGRSPPR